MLETDLAFEVGDIHWAYSKKMGVIPYIINHDCDKLKQVNAGLVLLIDKNIARADCVRAALKSLSEFYSCNMSSCTFDEVFRYVGFMDKITKFGMRSMSIRTPITVEQVEFLRKNYNNVTKRMYYKQHREEIRAREYKEAREKTFDF